MKQAADVVIVGGGVIGCAIAWYLRRLGRDVLVLERGEIGAQASEAAAGLLAPLGPLTGPGPYANLLLTGCTLLTSVLPELEAISGITIGYERTGALRTVRNPRRVAHLQKRMQAWQPLGLEMHWLSGEEARRREPALSPAICAAIYVPEEAQVQAGRLVQAFAVAARKLGAQLCTQAEVVALRHTQGRVIEVLLANNQTVSCKHLVVATGAWAAQWGALLNLTLPVQPLRGQMLMLRQPAQPLRHIIFGEAAYLAPRGEEILVGATKDEAGFDVRVTEEGLAWLSGTVTRLAPALATSPVERTWAGLRPKTPDLRPVLGPAPGFENVTLATGHNSVGIMLSAITGQTMSEYICTGEIPDIVRSFGPERFVRTVIS